MQMKKFRDEHAQFVAEGVKMAEDLLNSDMQVAYVYATQEWLSENHPLLEKKKIEFVEIKENELKRISSLMTPNQVLCVVAVPANDLSKYFPAGKLTLVLDGISDPGNLGTILRTADWFGIRQVVCSEHCVEAYNPKVVQATMGSIFRVNVYQANLLLWLSQLPKSLPVYGALLDGENVYEMKPGKEGIIIIGNESKGISGELLPYITRRISIPADPTPGRRAESLNAAVAAGIICAEFRKKN